MDPKEAARLGAEVTGMLPANFMLDAATYERGAELGFEGIDFYFAGRGGALGDVDGDVVAASFVFFNPLHVAQSWERARKVMAPHKAALEFAQCCRKWALDHLHDEVDYALLAELLERVILNASPAGVPLFAAWRKMPEPKEPKALALHRLNVVRELRGGLHGCAVIANGITPREALMVKTPFMAAIFGWSEPHPEADSAREAWERAEEATDVALGTALSVLDDTERAELVDLLHRAYKPFAG